MDSMLVQNQGRIWPKPRYATQSVMLLRHTAEETGGIPGKGWEAGVLGKREGYIQKRTQNATEVTW